MEKEENLMTDPPRGRIIFRYYDSFLEEWVENDMGNGVVNGDRGNIATINTGFRTFIGRSEVQEHLREDGKRREGSNKKSDGSAT